MTHTHNLQNETAAEWEYRNQNKNSMTPSQMKREVDIQNHQLDNHTAHMRSQVSVLLKCRERKKSQT